MLLIQIFIDIALKLWYIRQFLLGFTYLYMFNKQFRKGVKEINDAIICEMQAYIIVACINVYNKTAPKFVKS